MSDVTQIWEYGKNGELISEVALDMVPADQLYRTPPPRTGNILDEYDSDGLLTIPFENVRSLTSRMGDVIYPEAIEYRKSQ